VSKALGVLALWELLGAVVLVIVAADAFTNAVEWIDARTGLTSSAAGAVVAAVGSSLPETIVAFIALVILRDARSHAIGVGTVVGAPFMLGTVILSLMGVLAIARAKRDGNQSLAIPVAPTVVGAGLFIATFALALAASFVRDHRAHVGAAVLVMVAYAGYLVYHLRIVEPEAEIAPPPLRIAPRAREPSVSLMLVQLVISLGLSALASRWLVAALSLASIQYAIAPFVISFFVSPFATELPEATNIVLWSRRREDTLAMNNVLGAMMFQSSIALAIAMVATPWVLPPLAYVAGVALLAAVGLLLAVTVARRRVEPLALVACGAFYVAFIVASVLGPPGLAR
jgi:cation:H+ antiporter